MKYNKEVLLSTGPYKTVRIAVTECDSFEEADKELMKEINKHKELKEMNAEEIEKCIGD